jgi:hypothetical protein
LNLLILGHPKAATGHRERAYDANRRAAVADAVDADPVAACVREIMAERTAWIGSASDLLRAGADLAGENVLRNGAGWPNSARALASRLRRAQTPLRAIGIEIGFSREGRAGSRIIKMHATFESSVSSVSSVRLG